jgi:phosphoglycerol geranylgeranyltransferase
MHFIYLEGGSGAKSPVPPEMIRAVKRFIEIPLVVGGGIKSKESALAAVTAGANIVVTGNVVEAIDAQQRLAEIVECIKRPEHST